MKLICLLLFLVPFSCLSQDTITTAPVYNKGLYYERNDPGKACNGVYVSYYNNIISRTMQFRNGLLIKTSDYYSNGKIQNEKGRNGDVNSYEGYVISYYGNGNKQIESVYKNSLLDSTLTQWYEDGTVSSRCQMKAGKQEGISETFYANAQLKEKGNMTDGHRTGQWTEYFDNGTKKSEGQYITVGYSGNCKTGSWTYWYDNGQKKMEIEFEQPYEEGTNSNILMTNYLPFTQFIIHNFWKEDGTQTVTEGTGTAILSGDYFKDEDAVKLTTYFLNGKRTGTWQMTLFDECLKMKIPFNENGKLDGKVLVLHCNGDLQWIYNYSDGSYISREGFDKTY